jgi:hypothetical protein
MQTPIELKKFILLSFSVILTANAQIFVADSVTVVPGDHYRAGPIKRFLLGDHWRDLWGTPITVPVIDLERTAGGLIPTERGGGFQTRSLRFRGNDGKEYKFRSLDKDPGRLLPDELNDTFVEDLVQDQISWTHPYSAIIAAPIITAAGILHAPPVLVVLPVSDQLGEFKNDFGGVLGTIEENPDDNGPAVFARAEKIKGTYSLFRELDDDHDEAVDAHEYLKARLIDLFLGDWDRHVDQWKWAGIRKNGIRIWQPIPRDRDQAFAKIDGLIPWGITLAIKQIESYEKVYPLIDDMTWSGRHLDRKFLSRLSKDDWESVTTKILYILSDSLIAEAVQLMPAAMVATEGENMQRTLRKRRDLLREASADFYRLCAKYVDIHLSNKNEHVDVLRIDDRTVDVWVWKEMKESGPRETDPLFYRRFFTDETKEIRIFLKGGDDLVKISGKVSRSIDVHIDGGDGKDLIVDASEVRGNIFGFLPFGNTETAAIVYDSGKKTVVRKGSGTEFIDRSFPPPKNDTALYEPYRDYGHDFRLLGVAAYNSADGIILGGGQTLFAYRMKYDPYFYRMDLSAAYATGHNAFRVDYHGEFNSYSRHLQYLLHVRLSGIEVLRFFGSGNEFPLTVSPDEEEYYRVKQGQYIFHPRIKYSFARRTSVIGGIMLKHSDILLEDSTFIKTALPYGATDMTIASIHAGIEIDSRDHSLFPTHGFYARSNVYHFPAMLSNRSAFQRSDVDLRWYTTVEVLSPTTFAFRAFGEKVTGRYPFYEASFLGGTESVRGFEKQRFSGDASISVHSESRFYIGKVKMLLPFNVGGTLFAETGRVFVNGERSTRWHPAFGAGIWTYAVDKDLTVSVSLAQSREQLEGHVTTGFTF